MKAYLSKKAGATFYGGSKYTVVYHASDFEIICKLEDHTGKVLGYEHFYMTFGGKDEIVIYANWDNFLRHLDSIKDMRHFISMMKRPCPQFHSLLLEEHPSDIYVMQLSDYDMKVIGKSIRTDFPADYAPMALPFRNDIVKAVVQLSNDLISLYQEIENNCPLPLWKERLQDLWY